MPGHPGPEGPPSPLPAQPAGHVPLVQAHLASLGTVERVPLVLGREENAFPCPMAVSDDPQCLGSSGETWGGAIWNRGEAFAVMLRTGPVP